MKGNGLRIRFQYSLCRVVLMVYPFSTDPHERPQLSVLALSSRFDGRFNPTNSPRPAPLSVLALSSRFDGPLKSRPDRPHIRTFSTRSVESF